MNNKVGVATPVNKELVRSSIPAFRRAGPKCCMIRASYNLIILSILSTLHHRRNHWRRGLAIDQI
jgi:hypothetical protein